MKPTGPRDPLTGLPLTVGRVESSSYQIPPETIKEINAGAIRLLRECVDYLESGDKNKNADDLVERIKIHLLLE